MITRLLLIILISIPIGNLYSGTIDPNVSDKKYIEYGEQFGYVGKLCGSYEDGTKFCASAVAIDDHHILTAAHVVQNSKTCTITLENKEFCIEKVVVHKDFSDKKFGTADIAIGFSEKPFDLDFYPDLYDSEDEVGKVCCISGYGITGTFRSGSVNYDNKRRAGSNIIDKIEFDMLICTPSMYGSNKRTSLEFLIASGDSGGGLFIDNKLAGINSCVMAEDKNPNSSYGDESGHTRISKFIGWIKTNRSKK